MQSSASINPAANTIIATADQRQMQLDRPKQGIYQVKPLGGTFTKPTIVSQVQEKISSLALAFANLVRE